MKECGDLEDFLVKEGLLAWLDNLVQEENKDLQDQMVLLVNLVQRELLVTKDQLVLLGCLVSVVCLVLKEQREEEETLAFLAQREIQESKERGDNKVLLDHQGHLVRLVVLGILDLLDQLEKQEPLE